MHCAAKSALCGRVGARTQVAVFSPEDRLFPHRFKADESYQIGTKDMLPVSCYLDVEAVIKIAKQHKVDAVHPGYGFLSENANLSRRCAEEGIRFVGPTPEILEVWGYLCTGARSDSGAQMVCTSTGSF